MKRILRIVAQLPLATAAGAFLGVFIALVAAALSTTSLRASAHPLMAFAIAPLPAVLGAWIDWSRLWRPSRRTRFWSFALLALTALAAVEAVVIAPTHGANPALLALVPAVPMGAALVVLLGTRVLLFLGRRGVGLLGFELACGFVRRDEEERIVVDTTNGVLSVDRSDTTELGPNRAMDLSIGAPFALLGRVTEDVAKADPFRTEKRTRATLILGVASSPSELERSVKKRARAWVTYLLLLALGGTALAWAASYSSAPPDCQVRAGLLKGYWGG